MAKFVIEKRGASKAYKDGKHSFYDVGEVVEFDELPASLKGKAKPIAEPKAEPKATAAKK